MKFKVGDRVRYNDSCIFDELRGKTAVIVSVHGKEGYNTDYSSDGEVALFFEMELDLVEEDSTKEMVNHPDHYNEHPIECIDVIEHFNLNRGNAIKYVWRAGLKGNEEEDLRKAIWYIEREIKRINAKE